ncbi:MAG: leucine-rich repeat protein [Muribaculaceae bacterium]|nr:leucine-rich repeat protein [Muribaculaceae bacterium]
MKRINLTLLSLLIAATVFAGNGLERTADPVVSLYAGNTYLDVDITGNGMLFLYNEFVGNDRYDFSLNQMGHDEVVSFDVWAMGPGKFPSNEIHTIYSFAPLSTPKPVVTYVITDDELVFTATCEGAWVNICIDDNVVLGDFGTCTYRIPRTDEEQSWDIGAYASFGDDEMQSGTVSCTIIIPALSSGYLSAPNLFSELTFIEPVGSPIAQVYCDYYDIINYPDVRIYYYVAYSPDAYPDFNYSEAHEWTDLNQMLQFHEPGNYKIAAFAVGENNAVSDASIVEFDIPGSSASYTAKPLVYAHHVDGEKGLAVRVVDGIIGENEIDCTGYEFYELYGSLKKPEYFFYQINGTGEWQEYNEEIYLTQYGQYTISAFAGSAEGKDSEVVTATIDYGPAGYTSQQNNYIVHDGLVYYVSDAGNTVDVADYYFDHMYYFMNYPIIEPQRSGDIVIPAVIHSQNHDYTVKSIGCNALDGYISVIIPSTVTYINLNGADGHDGYPNLVSLTVEEGNPVFDSRDNCNAVIETANNTLILGCQNTVIPGAVVEIGPRAFFGCVNLTSITIPNSVFSIGDGAFYYSGLSRIICYPVIPPSVFEFTFGEFDGENDQTTLFVPYESLEDYQFDAEWGKFTHIVPFIGAGPGDINGDGSIAINDVTTMIDMLLSGEELPAWADVNGDGEVTIKDITTLIDMLLNGNN